MGCFPTGQSLPNAASHKMNLSSFHTLSQCHHTEGQVKKSTFYSFSESALPDKTRNSGLLCSHSKISARSDPEGTEVQRKLSFSLPTWKRSGILPVCPKAARNSWEGDERLELWGFLGNIFPAFGSGKCCRVLSLIQCPDLF